MRGQGLFGSIWDEMVETASQREGGLIGPFFEGMLFPLGEGTIQPGLPRLGRLLQ